MLKYNYHGHTRWCRHAGGEIEDYIEEAVKGGFDVISISEHVPLLGKDRERLQMDELDVYFNDFERVISKYGNQIKILKSFECEYMPSQFENYKYMFQKYNLDYLVLGHHFLEEDEDFFLGWITEPNHLKKYVDTMIAAMESGLFSFIAHPDVFGIRYKEFDEHVKNAAHRIFAASEKYDVPLEFNANGMRRPKVETKDGERFQYPWFDFWKEAKGYNIKVLVNSDCHNVKHLDDQFLQDAHQLALDLGLHVVDTFTFKTP